MRTARGNVIGFVAALTMASSCAPAPVVEAPMTPPGVSATTLSASDGGAAPLAVASGAGRLSAGDRFQGHYFCVQGKTDLVLTILGQSADAVIAVFAFSLPASRAGGAVAGSFRMRGTFDPDMRRLTLEGDSWIEEPNGYVMVDLDGEMTPQGGFRGNITGAPGCTTFTLDPPRGAVAR